MSIAIIISIIVAAVCFLASIVNIFVMQASYFVLLASIEERVVEIESRVSKNTHSGDLSGDLTKAGTSIGVYNCTAETNQGKVYTKSDNKLYFQDGVGTEHEVSLV